MSSAPAPSPSTEVLEQVRLWAASLSAESSSAASPVTWEILPQLPADAAAPAEGDVWMIAAFSGARNGELGLRMTPVAALCLLHEPDPNSVLSAEQKSKLVEFFRKVAGGVTSQSKAAGRDQLIQVEAAGAPAWPASTKFWLQAKMPAEHRIEVLLSDALLASLQTILPRDSVDPDPDAMPSKLGMFMDVELLVTMRFGGRRMLLKDILDLCTGSIVELDQQVQEPVDLLLDGKLIARGEVVVVDGNYGLRVTEILSNPVPAS
jgi:flagellar motor switch protein FliN